MDYKRLIRIVEGLEITIGYEESRQITQTLAKQIPQKAISNNKHSQACPICGNAVNNKYCPTCGQKICYA